MPYAASSDICAHQIAQWRIAEGKGWWAIGNPPDPKIFSMVNKTAFPLYICIYVYACTYINIYANA